MIPLLVRVLDAVANCQKELQSAVRAQPVMIAEAVDGQAFDVLEDDIGAVFGRADFEDLGDAWVVHARQGLALGFEA